MDAKRFELSCPEVMRRSYLVLGALCVSMVVLAFTVGWDVAIFPSGAFSLWFLAMMVLPVRVIVGDDGLYAYYGLARLYVPLASISTVERDGFTNGFHVVRPNMSMLRFAGESAEGERFMDAVKRVLRARQNSKKPELVFAREGRSFRAWAEGVRAVVGEARGYRDTHIPRDRALAHLRDAALAPELRVGAALALVDGASTEEKDAMDKAIAGVASPTLKRVLTSVTNGQLEEAEAAHEAFEEQLRGQSTKVDS